MFWSMLAQQHPGWPLADVAAPAPAPGPEKPRVGHPDRGARAQVKAARKAARRGRGR